MKAGSEDRSLAARNAPNAAARPTCSTSRRSALHHGFRGDAGAMQGFVGQRVAVGVIVHGIDGQFPTATMRGLLSMATEGLTSVDGGEGVLDGSINFILRAGDGDLAGWFQLAPEQFVKSELWEENPDRPLFIQQHGVAFSVHQDPL